MSNPEGVKMWGVKDEVSGKILVAYTNKEDAYFDELFGCDCAQDINSPCLVVPVRVVEVSE